MIKKLLLLAAILLTATNISTSSFTNQHKLIGTQNVPYALYPQHLTVYADKAWWGLDSLAWTKKSTIVAYVKMYYGQDKIFCNRLLTTIERESSFDPHAVSSTGAYGLMQLFAAASSDMGYSYKRVIKHPWRNIDCGAMYLRFCLEKANNDYELAYMYYVNGPWATLTCKEE